MLWKVDFTSEADSQLMKLDKSDRERIHKYAEDLEKLPNPRLRGEPLTGNLSNFWKYRIGKYRLICRLQDDELLVLVVKVGKRDKVYKRIGG
jgi:mRNA interferase RelE/StbE